MNEGDSRVGEAMYAGGISKEEFEQIASSDIVEFEFLEYNPIERSRREIMALALGSINISPDWVKEEVKCLNRSAADNLVLRARAIENGYGAELRHADKQVARYTRRVRAMAFLSAMVLGTGIGLIAGDVLFDSEENTQAPITTTYDSNQLTEGEMYE